MLAIGHTRFHAHPASLLDGLPRLDLAPPWKDDGELPQTPGSERTRPHSLVNASEAASSLLRCSSDCVFCHKHFINLSLFGYCKLSTLTDLHTYLFKRGRERGKLHAQRRAQCGARWHDPEIST